MRAGVALLALLATMAPSIARAACSTTYPVGTSNDAMVSFLAGGTNLPHFGPTTFQTPEAGTLVYNSANNTLQLCDGNAWTTVSTASSLPAADSLDFSEFKDAMTLDASTNIAASGTNVFSITNTGTGNSFVVNDQASDTTPFVVDADGNVGIGTTAPKSVLDLGSGALGRSIVWGGPAGANNHYASIGATYSSGDLALMTGLKLSAAVDQIEYSYTGTKAAAGMRLDYSTGTISLFNIASGARTAGTVFDDAANTKLTILANGNVGIGTVTPAAGLHLFNVGLGVIRVEGGGTGTPARRAVFEAKSDSGGRAHGLLMTSDQDPWFAGVGYNVAGSFTIGRHATQPEYAANSKLAITSSGNVGVGTTSPGFPLTVFGDVALDSAATTDRMLYFRNQASVATIQSDQALRFNAGGSAERMRIDASGNVGIGTTSPGGNVHVFNSSGSNPEILVEETSPGAAATINFKTPARTWQVFSDDSPDVFGVYDAANGAHRLAVTGAGNVGIGTTAPAHFVELEAGTPYIYYDDTDTANDWLVGNGNGNFQFLHNGTTNRLSLAPTGILTVTGTSTCTIASGSGATNCTSDARLKKDVAPIQNALQKLSTLNGVTYHWKDPAKSKPEYIGLLAQDVERVFPQAVGEVDDASLSDGKAKTLDYAVLVAPLIEAVKELKAANDNLRADNDALRSELRETINSQDAAIDSLRREIRAARTR